MSRIRGFTLIEVLLSIVIMAVLAQATFMIMSGVLTADETVEENASRLMELQKAFAVMDRDFTQAVPRQSRFTGSEAKSVIEYGEDKYQSDNAGISFVTAGSLNPGALLPRGEIARVWYRLKDKSLQRAVYPFPDTVIGYEPAFEDILSGVEKFELEFYRSGAWTKDMQNRLSLPGGIKIKLELADYGEIEKIVYVAAGEHR